MKPYSNQLKYYDFNIVSKKSKARNKGEKTKVNHYLMDVITFDIEVTSAWISNGKVIGYREGEDSEYWNSLQPLALCYIWQVSINDEVYYGRELREFIQVLEDLPKNTKIIIWVHNLSYEFHFLYNILKVESVFARTPHKPIKATFAEYPDIEFRCTYMLTRLSLEAWGNQIGVKKLIGDLDYEIIRTPKTQLTEKELEYCEHDCIVVYNGIKEYIKRYDSQFEIPLTQTGTVRQEVKYRLTEDPEYVSFIKKLVPKTAEEYKMLMNVFAGGYTHANRVYAGIVQEGVIEHYDFSSSYPTVMIAEKYPMSPWIYTGKHELPDESTFDDVAYILKIKFRYLKCVACNTYLQASKCEGKGLKFDNGRIYEAEEVTYICTEQDFLIIKETYEWESIEVIELWKSYKDYLPKKLTEYTLELYHNKTALKGIKEKEDLYMQSKQYINALFGMMVTAIVQADVIMIEDEWKIKKLTPEYVQERLDKLRSWMPRERRYFLSYSWGIYVTAYARRNLWKCINRCDDDVIYCDTDSIFVKGRHDFLWYDVEITEKLKKACSITGLDFEKTRPTDTKGKQRPLGIFTREDDCKEFITLGAKRYVERRNDGKLYLTVSGINKEAVGLLKDDIENFKDEFNFDKDSYDDEGNVCTYEKDGKVFRCVRKQLSQYVTDMPTVEYPDGYISSYTHGINMRRNGYKLTMTDEYKKLIGYTKINMAEFAESFWNKIRSTF